MDYGIVGNCLTSALVKKDASVDWMCYPDFSSPSVFARLLDDKIGGSFRIIPSQKCSIAQRYLENTAILQTIFSCKAYSFEVLDFFPRFRSIIQGKKKGLQKLNSFIRIIKPLQGRPELKIIVEPKPDYARKKTNIKKKGGLVIYSSGSQTISVSSNASSFDWHALKIDEPVYFAIGNVSDSFTYWRAEKILASTKRYWEDWCKTLILPERNRETIVRSAITLKLLTYDPTGAIIAAPTTSIPESYDNSGRNWDYRYCWVRDASFCVDALKKIGRSFESKKLINFLMNQTLKNDHIQIMYGIHGETRLTEQILSHLKGFEGQGPVRIGNAAYNQVQNDIYGELLDIIYLYYGYYRYERRMTSTHWRFIRYLVNQIKFHWERKDSGIWEARENFAHYTHSKLMGYVGVDRAIKLAYIYKKDELVNEWLPLRDEIKQDIFSRGYNKKAKAFTMTYNGLELDAAVLQMFYYRFTDIRDPRFVNTLRAIYRNLKTGELLQRYKSKDEFGKPRSAFLICTFWLIDALYTIGEKKKARQLYEKVMRHANHLGLFSEDIDIPTGKLSGNFPQAYTHISIINTSILLSEWAKSRKMIQWNKMPSRKLL